MFLWISSNSCPFNLLLVRSHQAEIIIVKRPKQGRNNVPRVQVEPELCDLGCRKNNSFTFWATLRIKFLADLLVKFLAYRLTVSPILTLATEQFTASQIFSTDLMLAIPNFAAHPIYR